MTAGPLPEIADRHEVLELLTVLARRGNVTACRLLLLELKRETETPPASVIDELAKRRGRGVTVG